MFTRDVVASVSRPLLELRAVGKITLAPGATDTVRAQFPATDLRFLGQGLQSVFEPGELEVLVGPCADRRQLLVSSITQLGGDAAPGAGGQAP